jgi:hypothetical protein
LGRKKVPSEDLRTLLGQVCETLNISFEGPHRLHKSTKREMLEWIEVNWEIAGEGFTMVTANQRILPAPAIPPFRISDDWHQWQSKRDSLSIFLLIFKCISST